MNILITIKNVVSYPCHIHKKINRPSRSEGGARGVILTCLIGAFYYNRLTRPPRSSTACARTALTQDIQVKTINKRNSCTKCERNKV